MAIYQGGAGNTTKYYSVPDDAAWTFPDSDWFIYFWTRVDDNTGTGFSYLFSNNNFQVANSINIFIREDSASAPAGAWSVATDTAVFLTSGTPGGDGKDRLVLVQRSGSNLQMYFCEKGQTATQEFSSSYSDGAINGGVVNVGRRVDGNSGRYYHDNFGDVVKGSAALTIAQITLLGQGVDPVSVIGYDNLDIWLPFREATSTVDDVIVGLTATRQATPVTSEHFPVVAPLAPVIPTVATGAQNISPTGIASAEAFGTPVITTGAVDITPSGIASEEAFGTAVLTTGAVDISPSGIASEEAFGTAVVTVAGGTQNITATGIASAEAFGSHVVTDGAKDIKIDFANSKVLNTDLQSTTLYFNGTDYFTTD